ncbi:hypothetical protein GF345_02950 [Candidatus Woesearchaeota archaeon]|nr:hypothetical protein [Candidatus Woesearchaeota archaeon]
MISPINSPIKNIDNRRAEGFLDKWVELFFFTLLIIGFIISLSIGSAFFSYIVIFLFGLMSGRLLQLRKNMVPFYLIVLGLLIGYLLGSRYGNWKIIVFVFIIGTSISWYAHEKEYIR